MRDVPCAKAVDCIRQKRRKRKAKRDFCFILVSKIKESYFYLTPYLPFRVNPSPFHVENPARGGGEGDKGGEVSTKGEKTAFFAKARKFFLISQDPADNTKPCHVPTGLFTSSGSIGQDWITDYIPFSCIISRALVINLCATLASAKAALNFPSR
jgi:hypothetical protein